MWNGKRDFDKIRIKINNNKVTSIIIIIKRKQYQMCTTNVVHVSPDGYIYPNHIVSILSSVCFVHIILWYERKKMKN